MADTTDGWYEESFEDFGGGLQSDYEKEVEAAAERTAALADQADRDYQWGQPRRDLDRYQRDRHHQEQRAQLLQRRLEELQARRDVEFGGFGGGEGDEDEEEEDDEIIGHVEAFIEAWDVPNKEIPKLTRILDKPHSERSDADKKLLKKIIAKSKKKKPKVKISRQNG